MEPKILAPEMKVRDADPSDNEALVELAALCPMEGDVSLCVERAPDFFALSRLEGDETRLGIVESDKGDAIASIGIAKRPVYIHGEESAVVYVGDLKVHPDHRTKGVGRALVSFALDTVRDLLGPDGMILGTMLAGNAPIEKMVETFRQEIIPDIELEPAGTIRWASIPLLWKRKMPKTSLRVVEATKDDISEMVEFWRRVAPTRQLAPVYDEESFRHWLEIAPGLDISSFLLARRPDGSLAGFFGLWDQDVFKQMRVQSYSRRLKAVRAGFNLFAPLVKAAKLAPAGGFMHYRTVVNLCVPLGEVEVLRALLLATYDRMRGGGYSFITIGLEVDDPLMGALKGLFA